MEWKLGKLIKNRTYKLWGVNLFDYEWTDTGETAYLKDYTDGIRKNFKVYSIANCKCKLDTRTVKIS